MPWFGLVGLLPGTREPVLWPKEILDGVVGSEWLFWSIHHQQHHLNTPYAIKPVLSSQTTIRPSQTKATVKVDTAAGSSLYFFQEHCARGYSPNFGIYADLFNACANSPAMHMDQALVRASNLRNKISVEYKSLPKPVYHTMIKVKIALLLGQHSSLVAHWLLVSGDHCLNPSGGEKISSFVSEL